ncbi:TPA: hypothetical protein DDW69_03110 [candidate division CPR2 bacterium]|uniref:ABC transporter permease n=1 Tax=candidate division CPR2 bacterium GW2011_GWC1_41_48 TaxID=1618344 RepID=A0A0G0YHW3_UNCC2|nr:MAG: ABC transporter permease [candidate division CPR2 bacterium GW2011_GWC2_39_35]KKR29235.1 MAG: ABC transporter permease [candidate division CPR2 bacterium GW2011_GWD2_39_7]KKS09121.1 MAG: ABC transporter permease [candidate division CPR2 bacterium GW2011_GWC1_41_48]OGB70788.1 MAG: hypothetical protein A2Y26_02835 [candidate division CPR2 bacterium GWD2_39_7]HBG81807.1 hypothetical protein [candidate division CPR2 bacterium]
MSIVLIARRNLFKEKTRFLITIGGVTLSVILVFILMGLYEGWRAEMTKFLKVIESDYWIGTKGNIDLSRGISVIPKSLETQIKNSEGVSRVTPFLVHQVSLDVNGKDNFLALIGMDKEGVIRPFEVIDGKGKPQKGEIIVDKSFVGKNKLKVGDSLIIKDANYKIVGISTGGNFLGFTYGYAQMEEVIKIADAKTHVNFFVVSAKDIGKAEVSLGKIPNIEVITKQRLMDTNAGIVKNAFLPILGVLMVIAFSIGLAVIGITIFTGVLERSKEYGVLKAIGYTNKQLFLVAVMQAVIAGIVGLVIGILLMPLIIDVVQSKVPDFIYEVPTANFIFVCIATLVMAAISSLIPLKRLMSIDPAEVFRA